MNRWWTSAALGAGLGVAVMIGCGGSTNDTVGPKTDTDSGTPPATPPNPPPAPNPVPPPAPPPTDGGKDSSINAPEVTINYMQTCPAFVPCDSDPKGTWTLKGGCIDSSIFDAAKANCPGLSESMVVIKAKGITTIDAVNVSQQSESTFSARVNVPASCKPSPAVTCSMIGAFLMTAQGGGFDTATCTGATDCSCDVTKTTTSMSTSTYTTNGAGVLTTAGGDKFDYCVDPANTFTTRQQNTNGTPGPATFTATK